MATQERKTAVRTKKAKQGTDCYIFEITCNKNVNEFSTIELVRKGRRYGSIKAERRKIILTLTLPHYVRANNIQPFTLTDECENIRKDICKRLKKELGKNFESKVKSIECNITQKVSGNASTSDVLNLLNHALLSYARDNLEYSGADRKCKLKKDVHTVISKQPHYYTLKAYNKTEEYRKKCKEYGGDINAIEDNVLRIEIILLKRTLERLFGKDTCLYSILSEKSLKEIMREYKRIYTVEIIDNRIKPYLSKCKSKLYETLLETNSVASTVAKEREIIPDTEVLCKAIEKWQKEKQVSNHAARDARRYQKKYDLPQDVISTLRAFKESCG